MNNHSIKITVDAQKDIRNIIKYIKYKLKEPLIADKMKQRFYDKLKALQDNPFYAVVDDDRLKEFEYRRVVVGNYLIFYRINETKKLVTVDRVMYAGIDWQNKL